MRWLVKPHFYREELIGAIIVETENNIISSCHELVFQGHETPELWGLRNFCNGGLVDKSEWQPITYDVFLQLGGNPPNPIIKLVDKGYIGRRLSRPQLKKVPEGYCKQCLTDYNLYYHPLIGTDNQLRCNNCLKPFNPIPFEVS